MSQNGDFLQIFKTNRLPGRHCQRSSLRSLPARQCRRVRSGRASFYGELTVLPLRSHHTLSAFHFSSGGSQIKHTDQQDNKTDHCPGDAIHQRTKGFVPAGEGGEHCRLKRQNGHRGIGQPNASDDDPGLFFFPSG